MYYRIATRVGSSPDWEWKSTILRELSAVFHWLRLYRTFPHDRLRIFACSSPEEMNDQLGRENQGLESASVTAVQFLQERLSGSQEVVRDAAAPGGRGNHLSISTAFFPASTPNESGGKALVMDGRGAGFLEKRRVELEGGTGGDHDLPYQFVLPTSMPLVLAWVKLLEKVQQGGMQP